MIREELFSLLSCTTNEDLLRIFPVKYENLETTPLDDKPIENKRYVFRGIPEQIHVLSKYNKDLVRFKLSITGKLINCLLYKQPFYLPKLLKKDFGVYVLYYSDTRKFYECNL